MHLRHWSTLEREILGAGPTVSSDELQLRREDCCGLAHEKPAWAAEMTELIDGRVREP